MGKLHAAAKMAFISDTRRRPKWLFVFFLVMITFVAYLLGRHSCKYTLSYGGVYHNTRDTAIDTGKRQNTCHCSSLGVCTVQEQAIVESRKPVRHIFYATKMCIDFCTSD